MYGWSDLGRRGSLDRETIATVADATPEDAAARAWWQEVIGALAR